MDDWGLKIAPGVYSIGQRQGGWVHAFLLDDGTDLTLVDTLFDTDAHRLLDWIGRIGRSAQDLKRIVLTHAHRSHLGGLAVLKGRSGATVCAHEWEADIVAGQRKAQGVTLRPTRPLRVYHLQLGLALGFGRHPACAIDLALGDGDQVGPLHVLHTPGHTPGHLAFFWPERGILFAGDAIATYPKLSPGWPAFNLNLVQHRSSLERLAQLNAPIVAVGHGEPITTGGAESVRAALRSLD
jgi:glyoxylase-like metal-dependent hydrolase (beta-lactamase superfamily II)